MIDDQGGKLNKVPEPVCVVIAAWNQIDKTLACLETVAAQQYPDCALVLVDNGSEQSFQEILAHEYPQVKVLTNSRNLGFAGGYNTGLSYGLSQGYELFFLLNNDTLLAPDCLRRLVEGIDSEPDIGLVTAKIYYASDRRRIWTVGNLLRPWLLEVRNGGEKEVDQGQWDQVRPIDFAPFCGVLLKRNLLERVGLLDEDYFLYYEDMDYCRRARQAGFELRLVPSAKIWHAVSTSSGGRDSPVERYWMAQSSGRYFRKHGFNWRIPFILSYRLASAAKMTARLLGKGRTRALLAYWLGLMIGWGTGRSTTPPPAWLVRSQSPVSRQ